MLAMEFVKDRITREPDAELAERVLTRARAGGLLLLKCGPYKNVVRLLPPLTVTSAEITRAMDILTGAVRDSLQ